MIILWEMAVGANAQKKLGIDKLYAELGLEDWYGAHAYKEVQQRFLRIFRKIKFILTKPDSSHRESGFCFCK